MLVGSVGSDGLVRMSYEGTAVTQQVAAAVNPQRPPGAAASLPGKKLSVSITFSTSVEGLVDATFLVEDGTVINSTGKDPGLADRDSQAERGATSTQVPSHPT